MPMLRRDAPLLTVVICTLNRDDHVKQCLLGLTRQDCDRDLFEVLVVDNGPSESIARLVADFAASGLAVRYAHEPRRGLTYARRRAWKAALGQYVGYLDDDAIPCPNWVSAAIAGFTRGGPVVVMLGGPVLNVEAVGEQLPFTSSPGASGLDLGPGFRLVGHGENLWGCNFVFRRSILVALDAFGEPLGHRDGRPGANEDILVQRQIELMGLGRAYDPALQIVHNTWRTVASPRQLDRLAYYTGVDNATMARLLGEHSPRQRGAAIRQRLRRLRAQTGALVSARRQGDQQAETVARRAALQSVGTMVGYAWPPLNPASKPDS